MIVSVFYILFSLFVFMGCSGASKYQGGDSKQFIIVESRQDHSPLQVQCENSKSYGKKIKEIRKEIQERSDDTRLIFDLGLCYYFRGDLAKSLFYFLSATQADLAIKSEELLPAAYHNISLIKMKQGKYPDALDYARKAYDMSSHPLIFLHLIGLELSLNLESKVQDKVNKIAQIQVLPYGVEFLVGSIHLFLKDYQAALQYFELGIENHKKAKSYPDFDMILSNHIYTLLKLERYNEASELAKSQISTLSKSPYYQAFIEPKMENFNE